MLVLLTFQDIFWNYLMLGGGQAPSRDNSKRKGVSDIEKSKQRLEKWLTPPKTAETNIFITWSSSSKMTNPHKVDDDWKFPL